MLKNRVVSMVLFFTMVFSTSSPVFAEVLDINKFEENKNFELTKEAVDFLSEHDIEITSFHKKIASYREVERTQDIFDSSDVDYSEINNKAANSYNESILALKNASIAQDFTDEQIQKYVEGLISVKTTVVKSESNFDSDFDSDFESYSLDRDGKTRTNNYHLYSSDRLSDTGIGYEVKSLSGYYQATAFATLPYVYRADNSYSPSAGYMFYTVSSPYNYWNIDVGLGYEEGKYDGKAWRCFYTTKDKGLVFTDNLYSLRAGSQVYFHASVLSNGYLRLRVLDANDFSTVHCDISYYVGDKGIYPSNAIFNRQITLCNKNSNFNTGAYLTNASFSNAYLYSYYGYDRTYDYNTDSSRRGPFGTGNDIYKVNVNDSKRWYEENISIYFD